VFLEAAERNERTELAAQFALLVTATHGGNAEIKALLKALTP
jgi:hypothetical protein